MPTFVYALEVLMFQRFNFQWRQTGRGVRLHCVLLR